MLVRAKLLAVLIVVFGLVGGFFSNDETVGAGGPGAQLPTVSISTRVSHIDGTVTIQLAGGEPGRSGAVEIEVIAHLPAGSSSMVAPPLIMPPYNNAGVASVTFSVGFLATGGFQDREVRFRPIALASNPVVHPRAEESVLTIIGVPAFDYIGHYDPAAMVQIQLEQDRYDFKNASNGAPSLLSAGLPSSPAGPMVPDGVSNAFVSDGAGGVPTLRGSGSWLCTGPGGVFGAN